MPLPLLLWNTALVKIALVAPPRMWNMKHNVRRPKFQVIATIPPCNVSEHDILHWPPLVLPRLCVAWLGSCAQVSYHDTRTKLDFHTDTTAVGNTSTALVIHDYEQPIHVH